MDLGPYWKLQPLSHENILFEGQEGLDWALFSSFSDVSFLGCVFIVILVIWVSFWAPMAPKMGLRWHSLGSVGAILGSVWRDFGSLG